MMKKLKKIFLLFNFIFISLSITSSFAFSSFNSEDILNSHIHSFFFSSSLNDHHPSHDTHIEINDSNDQTGHAHKHRHSENEKEHSHKHLNIISFSDIVINKIAYFEFLPTEVHSVIYFTYGTKNYDSYILEILKPPIYT